MFYTIKAVDLDLYVEMDGTTGAVTWGDRIDCMVFSDKLQAERFAEKSYLDYEWEIVIVEFNY